MRLNFDAPCIIIAMVENQKAGATAAAAFTEVYNGISFGKRDA